MSLLHQCFSVLCMFLFMDLGGYPTIMKQTHQKSNNGIPCNNLKWIRKREGQHDVATWETVGNVISATIILGVLVFSLMTAKKSRSTEMATSGYAIERVTVTEEIEDTVDLED